MNAIQTLLIQIAVILLLSRLLGQLMRLIHQPQVVGEMVAGIMLGPSLLGLIDHQRWMHALFPPASLGNLGVLSQLGVMLFMFLVGLELDPKLIRGQGKAALVTGTVGIIVPFVCGGLLGLGLLHADEAVTGKVTSPLVLCLFMGAAMSITAFPVLARILTERNLQKTKSGTLALTCAAMDDVMGWCILAFVLAVAHVKGFSAAGEAAHGSGGTRHSPMVSVGFTILLTLGYVSVMVFVVHRMLGKVRAHYESRGYVSQNVLAVLFLLLIASSVATDWIGIHQIFGAFMLGAVMPKDGPFVKHLSEKLEDFTLLFLLPLFFAYTGLNTELGLLGTSLAAWLVCGLIIFTASAGKFGGVFLATRWYGMNWRQGALLGVLMNTRGLMELIILNIGLSFGVLSKPLFAMMVLMALTTTFITTPVMRLIYSPARQKRELEAAAHDEAEVVNGVHVVVPVSFRQTAGQLVRMGGMLMGNDPGRLYAIHLDRLDEVNSGARAIASDANEVLAVARRAAEARNVPIDTVSYVTRNVGREIVRSAGQFNASWVVMGWHKPVFFKNVLGGLVGRVLQQSTANVAIFVDKGLGDLRHILVPYLGEMKDKGALMAAERLARLAETRVTVLHIVPPGAAPPTSPPETPAANGDADGIATSAGDDVARMIDRNGTELKIVESDQPLDVVAEQSKQFDLMVIGLSDEWDLQKTRLFGRRETIAQRSACSLLIVHANPQAPVYKPAATDAESVVSAIPPP